MQSIEELRTTLGGIHPAAAKKIKPELDEYLSGFVRHSPFLVMASSNDAGDCDATPRGGAPGFVKVVDSRTLFMPDIGGNRLFQSHENFMSNPKAGFIFMIPGVNVTARINGRVNVVGIEESLNHVPEPQLNWQDENSTLVQGLLLSIDEAYFHCPRSFQFADLWNTETQVVNAQRTLKDLKKG